MSIPNQYCGDEVMRESLRKVGSKLTLYQVYGLFSGCIAATNLVKPSQYYPMIFREEGANFESEEEANEFLANLMSLWNSFARWDPETDPFTFPDNEYSDTHDGLKQHVKDNSSLIEYFIKGLDLGGTKEDDFSEDGIKALKFLSEANVFFLKYMELSEKENAEEDKVQEKTIELIDQLEDVVADCIARINLGLKEARIKSVEEMGMFVDMQKKATQSRSTKIKRDDPCPCGSGKKYKKCCGQLH